MKKTGKVLSLVLSLALVASSLVATTASAASRPSETASIKLNSAEIALCNGGKDDALTSPELKDMLAGIESAELADHSNVKDYLSLKDVAITSGSDKVKLEKHTDNDGNLDTVKLTLKNADVTGTVTLTARYEGKVVRGNDEDANTRVYGTATFTATIYQSGKAYIAKDETGEGANPDALDTLPMNADAKPVTGVVEVPSASTDSAKATWKAQTVKTAADTTPGSNSYFVISATGATDTAKITIDEDGKSFKIANNPKTENAKVAPTGKIAILAQGYDKDNVVSKTANDRVSAKTAVEQKYIVGAIADESDVVISKYSSKTYIGNVLAKKDTLATLVDVTGCALDLSACTSDVTMKGGKIGDVTTPKDKTFTVEDGIVGKVTANGDVTVKGGSVGDVTVAEGKTLTVNGGKVGAVDGNGTVNAIAANAEATVTTGALSAKGISVDSNGIANVTTGNITAVEGATITLSGDMVKVGTIDGDYRDANLTLDGFKGTIAAPSHAYTEGINGGAKNLTLTVNGDSNATITGMVSLNEVVVEDGSTLTFADKAKIGDQGVTGTGLLKFAPNALYTTGDVTTSIRLTKDFKVGDVVFTAATDAVDENSFTGVGFTTEKVATSSTVDSFKVKTISLASININGSDKIPVGTTETYTATTYPNGTKLPDGCKISWSFDGNSDYLEMAADANDSTKCTVKAIKEDKTFASLNKGTLTATIVDEDGFAVDVYAPATFDVSIGEKPSAFKIDSVPGTMKIGQQYTVKITGTDATAPQVAFAGDFAIINSKTVSGYDTFVKFTAAKSGEHGVYVSGTKVAVIKVDTASICDTKTVTKKAGQSYTFKVTSSAVSFVPQFGVASISGNIKPTKQVGKDFYYTVKATSAKGAHGVYINGVKVATYTFA